MVRLFSVSIVLLIAMAVYGYEPKTSIEINSAELSSSAATDSLGNSKRHTYDLYDKKRTIYANIGYSFIYSKLYGNENVSGHAKSGVDWQLGYDWMLEKGIGFGFITEGFRSTYNYRYNYEDHTEHLLILYIGPQFIMKQCLANSKWHLVERLGIGYAYYEDYEATHDGFAYNWQVGIEYRVRPSFGVSANVGFQSTYFGMNTNPNYDYKVSGIDRCFVSLGARWHF